MFASRNGLSARSLFIFIFVHRVVYVLDYCTQCREFVCYCAEMYIECRRLSEPFVDFWHIMMR